MFEFVAFLRLLGWRMAEALDYSTITSSLSLSTTTGVSK